MSGAGLVAGPQASPLRSSSSPRAVCEVPAPGAQKKPASLCLSRTQGGSGGSGTSPCCWGAGSGWAGRSSSGAVVLAAPLVLRCRGRSSLPPVCLLDRAQGLPVQAGLFCGSASVSVCLLHSEPPGKESRILWGGALGLGGLQWWHLWSLRTGSDDMSCPQLVQAGEVMWAGWPQRILIKSEIIPSYKSRGLCEQDAAAPGARQPLGACREWLLRALSPVWVTARTWGGGKRPRRPPCPCSVPSCSYPGRGLGKRRGS